MGSLKHLIILSFFNLCFCEVVVELGKRKDVLVSSNESNIQMFVKHRNVINKFHTVTRRHALSAPKCPLSDKCETVLPGSTCINGGCVCPEGHIPNLEGNVGCFVGGKKLRDSCNISDQCGEGLSCSNNICLCPDGSQLIQAQGINLCMFWRTPTRFMSRCKNNEDCHPRDPNSNCLKHYCQCNHDFQQLETRLFGLKHLCFKTFPVQCSNSSQCLGLTESSNQYCICHGGSCHCILNTNSSMMAIYSWLNEKPTWYQRWKKDLILATRLLFISVVLFFVPCFIYATLGIRERNRQLFSHLVQPSRGIASNAHYSQRRSNSLRPPIATENTISHVSQPIDEAHHVEITFNSHGVNSRLLRLQTPQNSSSSNNISCESQGQSVLNVDKMADDDLPPSYDEIMRTENMHEIPPPPYREV